MNHKELVEVLELCGLTPMTLMTWNGKTHVPVDDCIDGDVTALVQFVRVVERKKAEEIAQLVEKMGMEGYGTLAIAAAIRGKPEMLFDDWGWK